MSPRSLFPLVLTLFCTFAAGHETRESRSLKQSDGVMAGAYGSADVQSTRVQVILHVLLISDRLTNWLKTMRFAYRISRHLILRH